jgi:hypothetical protein
MDRANRSPRTIDRKAHAMLATFGHKPFISLI